MESSLKKDGGVNFIRPKEILNFSGGGGGQKTKFVKVCLLISS